MVYTFDYWNNKYNIDSDMIQILLRCFFRNRFPISVCSKNNELHLRLPYNAAVGAF